MEAAQASSSTSSISSRPFPFPSDDSIVIDVISQSIKDSFALKKSISIKTVSGSGKITVIPSPIPSTSLTRNLHWASTSGSLDLDIQSALGPFLLASSFQSTSGSFKLSYPVDWCGIIELVFTSGDYKLKSDNNDVRVVSDIVDRVAHERRVVALKGNPREGGDYSTLRVASKSGSLQVKFEKKPPLRDMTAEEAEKEEVERRKLEKGKEGREKNGVAVTRAAYAEGTALTENIPEGQRGNVRMEAPELPPSYDQSEAEIILSHVAGRD